MQHIAILSYANDKVKVSREQKKTEPVETKERKRLAIRQANWGL
jgi:hypothetical protein